MSAENIRFGTRTRRALISLSVFICLFFAGMVAYAAFCLWSDGDDDEVNIVGNEQLAVLTDAEKDVKANPKSAKAHAGLAQALENMGRNVEAGAEWKTAAHLAKSK